ncbi:hypothetical protein HY573_01435 [Candidatus Parcubacteria bacterium]|nr:hypothetical protein [Candidatus Parcubacteria bacterium]
MLFLPAALIFLVLTALAFLASVAVAWHLLTYRLPNDLGFALALFFLGGAALLAASSVTAFLAVPWDRLPEMLGRLPV